MCFIKLEAFKPTYICTFDYVVLQWSVRHLAAAYETQSLGSRQNYSLINPKIVTLWGGRTKNG